MIASMSVRSWFSLATVSASRALRSSMSVSGRGSWGGRLFAWSVRVCSLVSRGRSICSIVSVSGEISDVGRAVSGRHRLLASCSFPSHPVRSCPLLFISCSSLPACSSCWRRVGVSRFGAQCGRLIACPVAFVPVKRCGGRGGSLVAPCFLG